MAGWWSPHGERGTVSSRYFPARWPQSRRPALAARPDAEEVRRRHAGYYRALAGQADRPLRGVGQSEWLERLQAEAGNLAAAATWHLTCDPAPLPHLFRILWPFSYLRDRQAEARPWVDQLLPAAASFDLQARAELEWAATVIANEVGDDAAALAARRRLEPLLEEIQDPLLHAVCQLVMAWTSPITGDFEGALREVSASLEELRGHDEPFWTALAAFTAGAVETALGRPDGAQQHLRVMRDLADRFGYTWLTASAQLQLGTLAIVQGRLDRARELLDDALDLSLAVRITRNVTLCLAAFAQLAFAEGDPERAALLAGAAKGLRSRARFSMWPTLRRGEAELTARIRQALGDDRFGQAFAAGSALSQQEAVAAIRDRPGNRTQPSLAMAGRPDGQQQAGEPAELALIAHGASVAVRRAATARPARHLDEASRRGAVTWHAVRHGGRLGSGVMPGRPSGCGSARRSRRAGAHGRDCQACGTATSSGGDPRSRPRRTTEQPGTTERSSGRTSCQGR